MELKDYFSIIKRRFIEFICIFIVILSPWLYKTVMNPEQYIATTELILQPGRRISEESLTNLKLVVKGSAYSYLSEARNLLSKQAFQIAAKILTRDVSDPALLTQKDLEQILKSDKNIVDYSAEGAHKNFAVILPNSIQVNYPDATQKIVDVTATGKTSEKAVSFSLSIAHAIRLMDKSKGKKFLIEILEEIDTSKKAVGEKLRQEGKKVLGQIGVYESFTDEQMMVRQQIMSLESAKETLKTEREELRTQSLNLQDHLQNDLRERRDYRIASTLVGPGQLSYLATLEHKKFTNRLKLNDLLLNCTEVNPDVKSARAEAENIQSRIENEKSNIVDKAIHSVKTMFHELQIREKQIERSIREKEIRKNTLKEELSQKNKGYAKYLENKKPYTSLKDRYDFLSEAHRKLSLIKDFEQGVVDITLKPEEAGKIGTFTGNALWLYLLLALCVAGGTIYFLEYVNNKIRTEYDVKRYLNLPVLSNVPILEKDVLLTGTSYRSPLAEMFNISTTLIRTAAKELDKHSMLVCSSKPEEGKTTISINMAIAMARKGLKVVLIDGDMHKPNIHSRLNVSNELGLSVILKEPAMAAPVSEQPTADEQAKDEKLLHQYLGETEIPNLYILPCGPIPSDPVALLESVEMKNLMQRLQFVADFVIIDSPPLIDVGDTIVLATLTDASLLVIGANDVSHHEASWGKYLLNNVGSDIMGVVINRSHDPRRGGKYYYYHYSYGKETRQEK